MRAWTVDADDIHVAEDFDASLLHRTPEIDTFLSPDRDDKFIVIGTKGFGKTLLLKAKRILYQQEKRAACLPAGSLLDKPIGDKIFGAEALAFFAASPLPWSKLWLTAIAVATLKHLGQTGGLRVGSKLAALVGDTHLRSVVDHFVRLLDFSPSDLQRSATDTDGRLVPLLRSITSPIAIFIDGVDEYFNKHIEGPRASPSVTGQLSPNIWYFAQLGLVEVAYQLRRINHHLKVFAAVRKEAYSHLAHTTVMAQQYRGSAVDIVYSPESLREIFLNNIRLEKGDRMVRAERRMGPIEAFLGRTTVVHTYTRDREDAFEYLCRHTLLRPRDLMTVGEHLAALRPEERAQEHRLKEVVNQAATEIAYEYLAEIGPVPRRSRPRPVPAPASRTCSDARAGRGAVPGAQPRERGRRVRPTARVLCPVSRRAARLRSPGLGARGVGPAVPAAGRGNPRGRRGATSGDALLRAPGPVGRDRSNQPGLPRWYRARHHCRLRAAVARDVDWR